MMENFFSFYSPTGRRCYTISMGILQALKPSLTSHIPFAALFLAERFVNGIWQSKLNSIANFQTTVTGQLFTASLVNSWQDAEKKTEYSPRFYHWQCQYKNKTGDLHFSASLFQAACRLWHMSSHQFKWASAIGSSITNERLNPCS